MGAAYAVGGSNSDSGGRSDAGRELDQSAADALRAAASNLLDAVEFMTSGETATQRAGNQPIPPVGTGSPVPAEPVVLPMHTADP